jgi:hypothetical protein
MMISSSNFLNRSFPRLTKKQRLQLQHIKPVISLDVFYYPCSVILSNSDKKDRVYIVQAKEFIEVWGVWPEDDKYKKSILIEDVVEIQESNFRLPPDIAQRIYNEGESGMGYYAFTLKFNDGTTQSCGTGGAVDFVPLPEGKEMSDIIDVQLHTRGIDPKRKEGLDYYWCLYSE